jgi:hypothetical protein
MEQMVIPTEFRLFRGTENLRNSIPTTSTEDKTTRNSVPLNKNRSKLSELPSEHFSGRENNTKFRSVEKKLKHTVEIPFQTLQRKRKQLRILFRGTNIL